MNMDKCEINQNSIEILNMISKVNSLNNQKLLIIPNSNRRLFSESTNA